jgi:hypothetical protein
MPYLSVVLLVWRSFSLPFSMSFTQRYLYGKIIHTPEKEIILYICIWIVGGNCPMKVETRTPFPDTFVRDILKTGTMKTIPLTQGKVALVDDEDYEYLNQWRWYAQKDPNNFYAVRNSYGKKGKQTRIIMHRLIMDTPELLQVDHIDHNGLNNQKHNLRNCTRIENLRNRAACGFSRYLGVSCLPYGKRWQAKINVSKKNIYLGVFKTKEEAARAYDKAAKEYYGEFANLNYK